MDFTKLPLGQVAIGRLVERIANGDDRLERHYLEVKGPIDLTEKVNQAKVAKFILGAANRMPEKAAPYFDGHAIMVIGVSPGAIVGVPAIEALDLERALLPFLSTEGPRWDVQRLSVGHDRDALLIIVAPPEPGHPPFVCHRNFQGAERKAAVRDGDIYVRADGETRLATSADLKQLLDRGARRASNVELQVEVSGSAARVSCDSLPLESYVAEERRRLLDPLKPVTEGLLPSAAFLMPRMPALVQSLVDEIPEDRTEDAFRAEVATWAEAVMQGQEQVIEDVVAATAPQFRVKVRNGDGAFLEDAQLSVHLEGEVVGLDRESLDGYSLRHVLPAPPRKWGPRQKPAFGLPAIQKQFPYLPPLAGAATIEPVHFRNSGSVTITVDLGDLRPRSAYETRGDRMVLVSLSDTATEFQGTWVITARAHHEVFEGELSVPVAPLDVTDRVANLVKQLKR